MIRSSLAIVAAGLLASTAASAQTFSFESPSANYFTYNPTGFAGVTFNANSGVALQGSPFFSATPPDGSQAAFIQNTFGGIGVVSFALSGLSAGTTYQTTFYAAQRPDYGTGGSFNTAPINVSFNGSSLGVFTATSLNFTQFTVPSFVATGATGTLAFTGVASPLGEADVIFDLVKITATSVTASVPEPATWGMMLLGLGMVGGSARYRRRATGAAIA